MKGKMRTQLYAYRQTRKCRETKVYKTIGYRVYQCNKVWYPDRNDAKKIADRMRCGPWYNKVKVHKNTIYATRYASGFCLLEEKIMNMEKQRLIQQQHDQRKRNSECVAEAKLKVTAAEEALDSAKQELAFVTLDIQEHKCPHEWKHTTSMMGGPSEDRCIHCNKTEYS